MIIQGDVLEVAKRFDDNTFDGMLSDFPYGWTFMGKKWDKSIPSIEYCKEIFRVLKPGAFCMVFGGTRTWHRLAVALENAGFEMRDTLMWLYGSGFPKSYDISKGIDKAAAVEREVVGRKSEYDSLRSTGASGAPMGKLDPRPNSIQNYKRAGDITLPATPEAQAWQGYGTALKPAWEPILLIRKPLDGNNVNNALKHGCGGLNIDGGRIGMEIRRNPQKDTTAWHGNNWSAKPQRNNGEIKETQGRWPANLILDEESAAMLDEMSGELHGAGNKKPSPVGKGTFGMGERLQANKSFGDSGGASRFFYCAKASARERNAGLEEFEERETKRHGDRGQGALPQQTPQKAILERNHHPTVKPLDLCRYLATLILPPARSPSENGGARKLFVPFAGSGSEMIGGLQAGWDEVTGIEIDPDYCKIAEARIAYWTEQEKTKAPLFAGVE